MAKSNLLDIINPLASNPPAPEFFKPFGDSKAADKYNKKLFQIASIIPVYTLLGLGIRSMMSSKAEELQKLEKAGPIATAMTSISQPSSFGSKSAADFLYQSLDKTAPIAAVIASILVGMKMRDKKMELDDKASYEKEIKNLEGAYNKELAKRLYPNSSVKMPKTASDYSNKKASSLEDALGSIGIIKLLAPAVVLAALTTGYASKKYFDANSSQRKKARELKKGLEAHARVNWVPKMELPSDDITGDATV